MFSASQNLKRHGFGQLLTKEKAQVTLEFTFCFIIVIIILLACFSAFLWAGRTFVERQKAFDATSNSYNSEAGWVDFYQPQDMNLTHTINRE
jgi:uncharacterized protein (UPF0333 family)